MKKKLVSIMLVSCVTVATVLTGCGSSGNSQTSAAKSSSSETETNGQLGKTTVVLFAAKSLNSVMDEIIKDYNETQPNVTITPSYDSSGTLMTQIEEGAACDVFFSADQKQMDELQNTKSMVISGTRHNVVNNQVCVVTYKGSNTKVKGLTTLSKAKSIALAAGSVPVGKYTRQAMVNAGMLAKVTDVSTITSAQVSKALGGVEINECANVGAVTAAVSEGSNEVGTVYYSDTYGMESKLVILQKVSYDLTGDVIYPIAEIENKEANTLEQQAAKDFIDYVKSDKAKALFDKHYFDTNVED